MLVGDVRRAIVTVGCSCTLSGGSQWSPGPTYISKYAHVRRASLRRKCVCSTFNFALRLASGRLIHQAIAGDAAQSSRIGPAIANAAGLVADTATHVSAAVAGPTHMERNDASRSVRSPWSN